MAVKPRSGSQTWFAVGENLTRGTPIAVYDAPVRDNTTGKLTTAGMVQKRFPFTEFSINDDPQIIESTLIRAFGAASADIFGLFSAAGRVRTGILPLDLLHLFRGCLNPSTKIESTKITGVNVDDEDVAFAQSATTDSTTISTIKAVKDGNAPSKLQLTFSAAPTAGTVTINGVRKIGRPNNRIHKQKDREVLTPRKAVELTTKSWADIESITFSGILANDVMVTGAWDSGTYETLMRFNTANTLFEGWTVQGADGGAPFVAEDVTPIGARINVTSGGASVDMDVIATLKDELRVLAAEGETLVFPESEITHFPASQEREQPGWGNAFFFGGEAIKATGLDIAIALNIATDTEAFDASRFATEIIQSADRTVTFAPTLRFVSGDQASDTFTKWQQILRGDVRSSLLFRSYNYLGDGSRTLFEIQAPSAQMNANEVVSAGSGPLTRRTGFKALPSASEASEIVIRTETKEQFSEG